MPKNPTPKAPPTECIRCGGKLVDGSDHPNASTATPSQKNLKCSNKACGLLHIGIYKEGA